MAVSAADKKYKTWIVAASIAIPAVVALLYLVPKLGPGDMDLSFLPFVNACLNGLTTIVLILGFIYIRNKKVLTHRRLMTLAIALSILFLASYVLYHSTSEPTSYGGQGFVRKVYYFLLITHIILAAVIVPLVLVTYVRALAEKFDKHRKLARITLPLWLYVCITGVVVYIMLSPYYG